MTRYFSPKCLAQMKRKESGEEASLAMQGDEAIVARMGSAELKL